MTHHKNEKKIKNLYTHIHCSENPTLKIKIQRLNRSKDLLMKQLPVVVNIIILKA
jgi:hypothetical protein